MQDKPLNPHRSTAIIRTPDQRLRVFVSSTLQELAEERVAAREAITHIHLTPVMFELGARPHPPRDLYRAYLDQSHIFIGIYWQKYGWIAPDMTISGLEDEYRLVGDRPKLIYVKSPAPERDPRLTAMLDEVKNAGISYKPFTSAQELTRLIEDDLSLMLSERFETALADQAAAQATVPAATPISNLPLPTSSLIGRESDIAAIAELLLHSDVRLVTLIGPGGIGKTRLSIEVGHRVKDQFVDGACFVPLANARDTDGVVAAMAAALRIDNTGDTRPFRERVKDTLKDKQMLLVLDNFEQAIPAAPFLSEILAAAPKLEIIVSSRTLLRLQGEHGYDVKPLTLPPASTSTASAISPANALKIDAVRLFVDRARAAKTDFALTVANVAAVMDIVRKLDGLPLAIELAAARTRLLTAQALLLRLDNALQTLTSGARDLPVRQQTLRNTLDWSYSLLTPEEQTLFARLAIFESGCTFDAAQTVCVSPPLTDALDGLASLVDKSLLQQLDFNGEPRFHLLQTIREYAEEKLAASGEEEAVRKRHADFFNNWLVQAQREMHTAAESKWLAQLEMDRDNLQATMRYFVSRNQYDVAAHIGWTLWHFWVANINLEEWRQWTSAMVATVNGETSARAKAITLSGSVAVWSGDNERGINLLQEGAEMFGRLGKIDHQTEAMMMLGIALLNKGDAAAATQVMERGLGLIGPTK